MPRLSYYLPRPGCRESRGRPLIRMDSHGKQIVERIEPDASLLEASAGVPSECGGIAHDRLSLVIPGMDSLRRR